MSTDDARNPAPLYDMRTRVLVWERGRLAVGEIIAVDETYREPLYGIRFSERRKLMFRASEVVAYQPERYATLDTVLRIAFAAFHAEDGATGVMSVEESAH